MNYALAPMLVPFRDLRYGDIIMGEGGKALTVAGSPTGSDASGAGGWNVLCIDGLGALTDLVIHANQSIDQVIVFRKEL